VAAVQGSLRKSYFDTQEDSQFNPTFLQFTYSNNYSPSSLLITANIAFLRHSPLLSLHTITSGPLAIRTAALQLHPSKNLVFAFPRFLSNIHSHSQQSDNTTRRRDKSRWLCDRNARLRLDHRRNLSKIRP
jgi:hypothetical protein